MWVWSVVGWACRGLGLCALGPMCAWACWAGGKWLSCRGRGAWFCWVELEARTWRLHRAPHGEARLAPLRQLAALAKSKARGWIFFKPLPPHLLLGLLGCLEASGAKAAPLVLDVLAIRFLGHWDGLQCAAARAEIFSETSLARLRLFFLYSRDGTVDKAFLRLFAQASSGLADFSWNKALAGSGQESAVEGRAQLGRQQTFLRDPRVLRAVRGLLMDGDPHEVLPHALRLYSSLVLDYPQGPGPNGFQLQVHVKKKLGEFYLVRPILLDLFRNMGRIPQLSRLVRTQIFPSVEPEVAVEVMEGFVLRQLDRAEELSPEALGWLATAFPTKPLRLGLVTPPGDPFACPLGLRIRSQLFGAFGRLLRAGQLSFSQTWSLILPLLENHQAERDAELFGRTLDAFGRVPLRPELRYGWLRVWASLRVSSMSRVVSGRLVWAGGLARLVELILLGPRLDGAGRPILHNHWLRTAVREARRLLRPTHFELGREEAERRLLAWRDQGLGPLLHRFLDEPHQDYGGDQMVFSAVRELLEEAGALRLAYPALPHSALNGLHFPLW